MDEVTMLLLDSQVGVLRRPFHKFSLSSLISLVILWMMVTKIQS